MFAKRFPVNPPHPERNCWGCDRYCAADGLLCGNGSERTQHPAELFGSDWAAWEAPVELASTAFRPPAIASPDPAGSGHRRPRFPARSGG